MSNSPNGWKEGLSNEQIYAAGHVGSNALLLSGPGTGKTRTITRRALALLIDYEVSPEEVLILTFTRVAAHHLKEEARQVLEPLGKEIPYISTLHSFALRQLLRNSTVIDSLPMPLRIADDWEERHIIFENLKTDLSAHLEDILAEIHHPIRKIITLFNQLSADWETLKIELDEKQRMCQDARFIGAWQEHRQVFGYTLRSELVYQFKRAMEQIQEFSLEREFKYILVDEYQDLNACDLKVIEELAKRDGELFVAGDDDQSIYGFRYADPLGIRIYPEKYGAKRFDLEICYRCDKSILDLAEFIANLDYQRLPKNTKSREDAGEGEVHLLQFSDQYSEADWLSKKCKEVLEENGTTSILVLMRSDFRDLISGMLKYTLDEQAVPVAIETGETPLDSKGGLLVLSTIRLMVDLKDGLAWYTLLHLGAGIGDKTLDSIRKMAKEKGCRFCDIVEAIRNDPSLSPSGRVTDRLKEIDEVLTACDIDSDSITDKVRNTIECLISEDDTREVLLDYLNQIILESDSETLPELLGSISASMGYAEQEFKQGMVNIMTMHKAKGLSSDVVFIIGAETQFIPGRNIGIRAEDERRLFYVSLTRARHKLYITYCKKRIKEQRYLGSEGGDPRRTLTPFLRDAPLKPVFMA